MTLVKVTNASPLRSVEGAKSARAREASRDMNERQGERGGGWGQDANDVWMDRHFDPKHIRSPAIARAATMPIEPIWECIDRNGPPAIHLYLGVYRTGVAAELAVAYGLCRWTDPCVWCPNVTAASPLVSQSIVNHQSSHCPPSSRSLLHHTRTFALHLLLLLASSAKSGWVEGQAARAAATAPIASPAGPSMFAHYATVRLTRYSFALALLSSGCWCGCESKTALTRPSKIFAALVLSTYC
ncbi:hypothetical protein K431DRAFT_166121 [Polychaeton citri CBS 116435]|uniref:Uncharacterized protein n=1 Tax=Polychaeton citri CBS 116435 TaxID=1314669 RepID=A0A9P4QFY8_9PEZI|nr:hypothetical protein K431DRAFT_166121 [Polychaeton citri CBS 116435]